MAFLYVLLAILLFGALIFIHELGHFLTARLFHVTVHEFSIGMGPRLLWFTSKKSGTVYALRLFPIGGFVSMAGEDEKSDDENAISAKPLWQRMIITAAGSFSNLLLGFIVVGIIVFSMKSIYAPVISDFTENAITSAEGGLEVGDKIIRVGPRRVYTASDVVYAIGRYGDETTEVTVIRDGATICSMDASKQRITESEIIKYMVGREMENVYPKRGAHEFGAERFRIGRICVLPDVVSIGVLGNKIQNLIVLQQFSNALQNKLFDPFLPHGLLVADLSPLSAAVIVMVANAGFPCPAHSHHHCTTLSAEQFFGKQVFCLRIFVRGRFLIVFQHSLHFFECIRIDDRRNCAFNTNLVLISIHADILFVFQERS